MFARAPGSSDAVHVILRIVGQIEIHDQLQIVHVDAARGHVGRDQKFESGLFEFVHDTRALRLRDAAVQAIGRHALRLQVIGQLIDHPLRVAENDARTESMEINQPHQGVEFPPWRHFVEPLFDRGRRNLLLLDLQCDGLAGIAVDQTADARRHGGRKERGLPLFRHRIEDLADVIAESHVEHAIRFIEHDEPHAVQLHRAALQVINDAARCPDNNLDAALQLIGLPLERRPAINRQRLHAALEGGQFVHLLRHLGGQLPRGTKHQHLHGALGGDGQLDGRNGKGRRFARAGLRLSDDIASLKQNRDGSRLDRSRLLETQRGDGFQNFRRKPQPVEGQFIHATQGNIRLAGPRHGFFFGGAVRLRDRCVVVNAENRDGDIAIHLMQLWNQRG